jgi:hypothetical protein
VEQTETIAAPPSARRLAQILFRDTETESLGAQVERVRDKVERLELLIHDLGEQVDAYSEPAGGGHVLFLPAGGGYELHEGEGDCPAPGDRIGELTVVRIGASPLPGDHRLCAFLERGLAVDHGDSAERKPSGSDPG